MSATVARSQRLIKGAVSQSICFVEFKLRCILRRCTQMKEPRETRGPGSEYAKLGKNNGIEGAKRKGSSGKEAGVREGSSTEKKVEEKNTRVEGKESWITSDGKKCVGKKSDVKKSGAIDKAKLLKLLNDDLDCSSDTSSEEGQFCRTWHGGKGKNESTKRMKNKVKDVPTKALSSKDVRSKDAKFKESKRKELVQKGKGRHSSSSSRTNHGSMSGSKGRKSEVLDRTKDQSKLDCTE